MPDRLQFHPELRKYADIYLITHGNWLNWIYPFEERIYWYGDVQLRCTEPLYEKLWRHDVPPPALIDGQPPRMEAELIEQWRADVRKWLAGFDVNGNPIATGPRAK